MNATGEAQLPELSLSIIGKVYFKEPAAVTANALAQADRCAAAGDHWKSADSIATLVASQDHLARFPSCAFAELAKARIDALKSKAPPITAPPLPLPAEVPEIAGTTALIKSVAAVARCGHSRAKYRCHHGRRSR
jgi:hypothetical protein